MDKKHLAVALLFLLFNITSIHGKSVELVNSVNIHIQNLSRNVQETILHNSSEQTENGHEIETSHNTKTIVKGDQTENHTTHKFKHTTFNTKTHFSSTYTKTNGK
ncbi:unnamed protein product [Ceratitis capitata]|uniref:(Mediterranean fruit fly) hypothetical protein n=1 Tax=Ceratitis capitata TaxID=7213 RepID=A0A811UAG0_CERCA|nr:unnamed protein product [Ceratitis capitata]